MFTPAAAVPKPTGIKERAVELDDTLEADDEVLDPNPKLHRFKAQRLDNVEYVADVAFLEHVLHTLITNHSITVTPADIEAMLSYFGECAVNTTIEHCMTRDVDAEPTCCGTTQKQREQAHRGHQVCGAERPQHRQGHTIDAAVHGETGHWVLTPGAKKWGILGRSPRHLVSGASTHHILSFHVHSQRSFSI
jgi:hypothetical protein